MMTPDALTKLAAQAPEQPTRTKSTGTFTGKGDYSSLDIVAWFDNHNHYGRDMGSGQHAVQCPWHHQHSTLNKAEDSDTCVWEAHGEVWPQFKCLHAHCVGRGIQDVLSFWADADRFCTHEFNGGGTRTFSTEKKKSDAAKLQCAREKAQATCEALKTDKSVIFEDEALEALALVRKYDFGLWIKLKDAIAAARLVREVENRLPKVSLPSQDPETNTEDKPRFASDMLQDCPSPALIVPAPYHLTDTSTLRAGVDSDGHAKNYTVAYAPIIISGRTRDAVTGAESLLLSWKWLRSGWQSRIVDRAHALTGQQVIKLASFGFPVADDMTRDLVGYLHRLEAANRPTLPCARVSSHLGWQGEPDDSSFLCGRTLILPNGDIEAVNALDSDHPENWSEKRVCFLGSGEGQDQVVDAFHARGSMAEWRKAVLTLAPYPKALIALYASFASTLLPIFNVPNFIVDFAHETTTGKSTVLRAAASVWGNPDERTACSTVLTWDASRVGLERTSEVLSCLPLCVDDTKKAKNPKMVADLIYAVASGRGRARGTVKGLARTPVWRTVMISNGEQPATSFTQDGGTRTRVIEVEGLPFEGQSIALGKMTAKLNLQLCQNYGHAGPQFVSWLQLNRESWPMWQERYQKLCELYAENPGSPESGRLAQYAALITIAGEMAHRAVGLPWDFSDPMQSLWSDMAAGAAGAAGATRAIEDILSWASSHEACFIGRIEHTGFYERTPPLVYGRWDAEEWEYLAIYPTILREALTNFGYSPDAILSSWREKGWLRLRDDEKKNTFPVPLRDGTKSRRMVVILREAFAGMD